MSGNPLASGMALPAGVAQQLMAAAQQPDPNERAEMRRGNAMNFAIAAFSVEAGQGNAINFTNDQLVNRANAINKMLRGDYENMDMTPPESPAVAATPGPVFTPSPILGS